MRLLLVCIGAALLVGCHHRQPKMSDAQMAELRADEPGMKEECLDKIRWGGIEAIPSGLEECYKLDPPQRWRGIWYAAFEVSRFCPESERQCSLAGPGEWIDLEEGHGVVLPRYDGEPSPIAFDIDFIGRKTSYPGHFGHPPGQSDVIIVDRLISAKSIQPTKD
jgi:hypothetical protein